MKDRSLPLVSIIIPTYNQQEYITDAIESALAQDYPSIEIIVSDDCSTDQTGQIASRYTSDPRLIYHRNENNLGRVWNYHNSAHNIANGVWAVNLDGDDYYTSKTFVNDALNAICHLNEDNVVAYCYNHGNLEHIKNLISYREIDENRILVSGKDYFLKYYKIGRFGHPNVIYRRDLGTKLGLYTLPYQACDFHSLIRIFLLGNIILDKRAIAFWRVHGTNTTIREVDDKQRQAMLTFNAIEEFASNYFSQEELASWRKNMDAAAFLDYIRTYVSVKRNFKAVKLLLANPHMKYWYFRCWARIILGK